MNDIKYKNEKFNFAYRVSAIIYNEDETKMLLFYGDDMDFYMLPGGKVKEQENSVNAIKREIYEELGYENLKFKFAGVSEELIKEFLNALNDCEFARFAPGDENQAMDKVYSSSIEVISKMENSIKH